MAKEMEFEHLLIFGIIAFVVYHFFLRRCPFCGLIKSQCRCLRERFTPLDTIQTSLDESINSVERARQAIEINACKFINIKPGRVGGVTNSIKINKLAIRIVSLKSTELDFIIVFIFSL